MRYRSLLASFLIALAPLSVAGAATNDATSPIVSTVAATKSELAVELKGTELLKSITTQASIEVDRLVAERDSRRWTQIGIFVSLLVAVVGFFGIKSISDIRAKVVREVHDELNKSSLLKQLVEESVKANVTKDIESRLGNIDHELAFYQLANLASSLRDRDKPGFTNTERDAVVEALGKLRARSDITARKSFAVVLEKIVDTFAAANLEHQMDSIESELGKVAEETSGIAQTFLQHYGLRALGGVDAAPTLVEKFKKYASACRRHRVYELALPYLLVFEHSTKSSGWEERVGSYIQDAALLDEKDKDEFKDVLNKLSTPGLMAKKPTGEVLRLSQKVQAFLAEFGDRLEREVYA